jgi:hypothetical protein
VAVKLPDVKQKFSILDGFSGPLKQARAQVNKTAGAMKNMKAAAAGASGGPGVAGLKDLKKHLSSVSGAVGKLGDGFASSMKRAASVGLLATAAIGGSAGAIGKVVTETAEHGRNVGRAAKFLGMSTDSYQELAHAAKMSGVEIENFDKGMMFLSRNIGGAANGGKAQKKLFKDLGVSALDAAGNSRPLEDVFLDVSDKMAGMTDDSARLALQMKLFGRGGAKMFGLMSKGKDGIAALRGEAQELGVVMSSEAIAKSREFGATVKRTQALITGLKRELGIELMPAVSEMANRFKLFVQVNKPKISAFFQTLARVIPKVANFIWEAAYAIARALKPVFVALGKLVNGFGVENTALFALTAFIMGPFIKALFVLPTIINGVIMAFRVGIPIIRGFMLALGVGTGPIGWIALAITGLITLIIAFRKELKPIATESVKALSPVADQFKATGSAVASAWGNMYTAIEKVWRSLGFGTPLVQMIGRYFGWVAYMLTTIATAPLRGLLKYIELVATAVGWFAEGIGSMAVALRQYFSPEIEWLASKFDWLLQKIQAVIGYGEQIGGFIDTVKNKIGIASDELTINAGDLGPEGGGGSRRESAQRAETQWAETHGGYQKAGDRSLADQIKGRNVKDMSIQEILKLTNSNKGGSASVKVDFKNVPKGTKIDTTGVDEMDLDMGAAFEGGY